jgi:hypothetical protein
MTPFIVDILWLLIAGGLGWFVLERNKPKESQRARSVLIIAFVSWFVFKLLYRAVIASKGTPADALLAGAVFGGTVLVICIGIKWFLTRKARPTIQG